VRAAASVAPDGSPPRSAPGAWLADPGGVTIGTTFQTGLYLGEAFRDAPARCTVEVVFDPRMLYCIALAPPTAGGPAVTLDVTIASGRVQATLVRAPAAVAQTAPAAGIPVAALRWRCVGEGTTDVFVRVVDPDGHPPSRLRIVQRPRG